MGTIKIGDRTLGPGQQPFIIAEAGINHNGELEKAFAMIAEAKAAGADSVKFQTFKAEEFITDPTLMFTYKSQGKEVTESMLEMFKRYQFTPSEWKQIKARCEKEGILFLSTPQNPGDLDLLLEIGVPAVKVGSDDFNNLPLLRRYARTGLPLLVSCGMADLSEVYQSLEAIGTLDGYPTVLFLCTSQYPTPPEDANLLKLKTLASAFPMLVLGFSDHTQGPLASSLAVALGAVVLEKHFTLDHDLPGPDHWFSEDPAGLREWVRSARDSHKLLGTSLVRPTAKELEMRTLARRSIVTLGDVKPGDVLDERNLGLRRPGDGLSSKFWEMVLGKKAARPLAKGAQVRMGDFA